jgi:acyl carrier protein
VSSEDRIRNLIVDNLSWNGPTADLTDDYPLLEKQVIDSFGMLKLISLIQDEFGVEIDDEDIVPTNWRTIGDIAELVASKQA